MNFLSPRRDAIMFLGFRTPKLWLSLGSFCMASVWFLTWRRFCMLLVPDANDSRTLGVREVRFGG
jgi:hypothetical protein